METQIRQVHFQITKNCNLRCEFCGQWGNKGFFSDAKGTEMIFSDWQKVINELEAVRENSGFYPMITVWGGEPLVSPYFDEIMHSLKEKGFETEVITNGVLLDKHKQTIENYVDTLYVSLDGIREIHDKIRGKGVFDQVKKNIQELSHKKIIIMSVITPELIAVLPEFLNELENLNIKELYLQDMIGLTKTEIVSYKKWLKESFDITAKDIESWENDDLFRVKDVKVQPHSFKIVHKTHDDTGVCLSPFTHPHIAWNGDVMYCTDFYDFSAGNVKNEHLIDIFNNEKSKIFRQSIEKNLCPTCNHCSWRSR